MHRQMRCWIRSSFGGGSQLALRRCVWRAPVPSSRPDSGVNCGLVVREAANSGAGAKSEAGEHGSWAPGTHVPVRVRCPSIALFHCPSVAPTTESAVDMRFLRQPAQKVPSRNLSKSAAVFNSHRRWTWPAIRCFQSTVDANFRV
jgi:hypothetical protein